MPSLETLSAALLKRHAPIKAVLLDQNGPLCGIGNYMVDEILYQSAIVRTPRYRLDFISDFGITIASLSSFLCTFRSSTRDTPRSDQVSDSDGSRSRCGRLKVPFDLVILCEVVKREETKRFHPRSFLAPILSLLLYDMD